ECSFPFAHQRIHGLVESLATQAAESDDTLSVEHKDGGPTIYVPGFRDRSPAAVSKRMPGHQLLFDGPARFGRVVIRIDPEQCEWFFGEALGQFSFIRHHGHAGPAPGRPKCQDYNFAAVLA